MQGCVDDDELRRYAPRLGEELQPLVVLEMAVEVAREDALEPVVLERQGEGVALEERRLGVAPPREAEHLVAVVDTDDLAPQAAGDEAGAAGDIQRPPWWERLERGHQLFPLLGPAGRHRGVEALTEPPVVVLGRPAVVVLLHRS